MKAKREILMVVGILAALMILIGCASDTMSSTVTGPETNVDNPQPFYTDEEPCNRENVCHGYEATTSTDVEKFEHDNGNFEVLPFHRK